MLNYLDDKKDKKISIALMSPFVILTIQYVLITLLGGIGSKYGVKIQLFSKILVGIIFIYVFPIVIKRNKIRTIVVYLVTIFIFLLHYTIFPENRQYMRELIFPIFFMGLPGFLYATCIKNILIFKQIMQKAGYIVYICGVILGILIIRKKVSIDTYSMTLSYYMLLPMIMFLDNLIDKFSFKNLIFAITSILITISIGSRGAILCIFIFGILKILRNNIKINYKKVMLYFIGIIIGMIGGIFFKQIVYSLYVLLGKFGVNSRTLLLLSMSEIHLSGRDDIYMKVVGEIIKNPFQGIGLAGDRRIIGGGYAHNFFIELLADFGLIIGVILSIFITMIILKSLLVKENIKYNLTIIWLNLGFIHLMVSSSYLIDIKFWIFLGITINVVTTSNNIKIKYKTC